jgi:uncharacterized protein YggE
MDILNSPMMQKVIKIVLVVVVICAIANFFDGPKGHYRSDGNNTHTITVTGKGDVSAVPDIAQISFTIRNKDKTVTNAQKVVTDKINQSLAFLKASGIDEKDIKTESYNSYPQYEWFDSKVLCTSNYCPPSGKQVLTGYEVSQSITVKVRNTDKTGDIIDGLGKLNITELNSPNFTIDNEDGLRADARAQAIEDAKSKAKILAKQLGVRLGDIVSFDENGNSPIPMYYDKAMTVGGAPEVSTPTLPTGENKIQSNVTIVFEIR